MARSPLFYEKLNAENVFHIYNRSNNKENIFVHEANHLKFLRNIERFILPFADILALNILPNHFHLIIEVKKKEDMLHHVSKAFVADLPPICRKLVEMDENNMSDILENRFRSMLSGYATYYNNRTQRSGNLFHRPFCRKWIRSIEYLKRAIYYVNTNTVKHGMHTNFLDHPWTSFHWVIDGDCSLINLEKLFMYFDGHANFLQYHLVEKELEDLDDFVIEEQDLMPASDEEEE